MAIKIYIDQGHNPENPNAGATGSGLREQDLVYEIGIDLAALLRNADYEVRLSRPTPTTQIGTSNSSSLRNRVSDANSWGADFFISLHTNGFTNSSATGIEAFAYSRNSKSYRLGEFILDSLQQVTGLRNRGVRVRPDLYVLRYTQMPAVLVELGFISNPRDAALMNENPQLFATGVFNGIERFTGGAYQK